MKLKKGSSNNLGASISNSSPKSNVTSSQGKKRKLGKNQSGWFNIKGFFLALGIYTAFVGWMFSLYWPANLHNKSSQNEVTTWIDGFPLPCPIKNKATISAINRATSDSCKQRIAEVACQSIDAPDGVGNLYATHLPNFCPSESLVQHNLETIEWASELSKHLFKGDRY